MATITLRSVKAAPLTNQEIDGNFTNLNDDIQTRLETPASNGITISTGSNNSLSRSLEVSGTGLSIGNADGVSGNPTITSNATDANTASTIVSRDSNGDFSAGSITVTGITSTGDIDAAGQTLGINTINAVDINTTTVDATTVTATDLSGALYVPLNKSIVFEGSVDDGFETTLTVINPTSDKTISIPDVTGTIVTTGDSGTVTNDMLSGSIGNVKLVNDSITVDGVEISLGGSGTITGEDLTWNGAQTFLDGGFTLTNSTDTSKQLVFDLDGVSPTTTVTLTIPDGGGTVATQTYVAGQLTALVAPGVIAYFSTDTAPTGWLKCNGAEISRTTYANLFAAIGEIWGAGDGSTTFAIPDLRGEFIRGWDDGRGIDTDRVFASAQAQATDAITNVESASTTGSALVTIPDDGTNSGYLSTGSGTGRSIRFRRGATETRPRNVALLPCIKA